jgi:hypothetical protein
MILTEKFLKLQNACAEGIQIAFDNKYLGQEYSDVICNLVSIGQRDFAGWLIDQKNTEAYVRANGKVITMGTTYQVFNPWTGIHTKYDDEIQAKQAIAELYKQALESCGVTVCQELTNENGDAIWISVNIINSKQVIVD